MPSRALSSYAWWNNAIAIDLRRKTSIHIISSETSNTSKTQDSKVWNETIKKICYAYSLYMCDEKRFWQKFGVRFSLDSQIILFTLSKIWTFQRHNIMFVSNVNERLVCYLSNKTDFFKMVRKDRIRIRVHNSNFLVNFI